MLDEAATRRKPKLRYHDLCCIFAPSFYEGLILHTIVRTRQHEYNIFISIALRPAIPDTSHYPETWVVDCKSVGSGSAALVYLGRYLYRGVIQEKDIVACENGQVRFRYRDSKTRRMAHRTLSGVAFLRLLLQHVLPKGFRRARHFGFLHPNSKRLMQLLHYLLKFDVNQALRWIKPRPQFTCPCCGGAMKIVRTRIPAPPRGYPPDRWGDVVAGIGAM